MATKKVEEKSKKTKSSSLEKGNNKSSENKSKKTVTPEHKEENVKKVVSSKDSLKEKDKAKKNTYDEEFEEYDDEDVTEEKEMEEEIEEEKVVSKNVEKKHKPKKNKSITKDSFFEQNSELFSLIKILAVVVVIIVLVYFVTALLNGDLKSKEEQPGEDLEDVDELPATFDNSKMLANSIFSKKDKEYYVFAYDSSDSWGENYYSVLNSDYTYIDDEKALPMFFIDLSDKFNSDYVAKDGENGNKKAQKVADLKLKNPTVIHIKKGKNVDYYEGDEATKFLEELIKSYQKKEAEENE